MTAPTITNLRPDFDHLLVGITPFKVELKGQPAPHIKVEKLQDQQTGAFSVKVTAPKDVPLPLLDQIGRKVLPGSKVSLSGRGPATIRHYALATA